MVWRDFSLGLSLKRAPKGGPIFFSYGLRLVLIFQKPKFCKKKFRNMLFCHYIVSNLCICCEKIIVPMFSWGSNPIFLALAPKFLKTALLTNMDHPDWRCEGYLLCWKEVRLLGTECICPPRGRSRRELEAGVWIPGSTPCSRSGSAWTWSYSEPFAAKEEHLGGLIMTSHI